MSDRQESNRSELRHRREEKARVTKHKKRKARARELRKHLRDKAKRKDGETVHTLEEGWWC